MSFLHMLQEPTPLEKKLLGGPFLDNHIFNLVFCWQGWGNPWITCLFSLKRHLWDWIVRHYEPSEALDKGWPTTPWALYSEHFFLKVMLLFSMSLSIWTAKTIPLRQVLLPFWLSSSLTCTSFLLHFTGRSREKPSHIFNHFAWESPQKNIQVC